MKILNTFIAAIALFCTFQLNAQEEVTLMTEDMVVTSGENFQIDVKVADFDLIVTTQFAMFWDPAVIEYIGVTNFGLPDMNVEGNFGETDVATGLLRFNWIDPDPLVNGVTLDDGSAIFSIVFKAVGGPAQTTSFVIDEYLSFPQVYLEVINAESENLTINIENSTITIDGVSASYETKTSDFVLMQNNPNPFTEKTNITFELNHNSNTQLSIYDHTGKVVFEQSKTYSGGSHTVQIARDLFQSAGSYFYTLKTDNATATRQLVVQ